MDSKTMKNLTRCGNPELLTDLSERGIVPVVFLPVGTYEKQAETPVVYVDRVEFGVVEMTQGEKDALLATTKTERKAYIKSRFAQAEYEGFECSLGFRFDSNRQSVQDVDCLIKYMEATNTTDTIVRDFNNLFHPATLEQVKQMYLELIGNGLSLYQNKWNKETAIDACETIEAVEVIDW